MIFQEMSEADLAEVISLESQCFKEPWNKEQCLGELNTNPFSHGWIVKDLDEIVAYAFLWETFEMAQLARIGVLPTRRNQGIGKFLLEKLCKRAKEQECEFMSLEVRASNEYALALYQSFDFIQVNVSKGYYPDGEDAIVLTKAL